MFDDPRRRGSFDDPSRRGSDDAFDAAAETQPAPARRSWRAGVVLFLLAVAVAQPGDSVRGVGRVEAPGFGMPMPRPGRRGFGRRMDLGTPTPGQSLTPRQVRSYGDAPLYDLKTLRTVFIQFPKAGWEYEL